MIPRNINYYDSIAYETNKIVKASPGTVYRISGYNSNAGTQYIQLHESATLPADTAVPAIVFAVAAASNFDFDLSVLGRYCKNGIVVCNSSTVATKTIGSADVWFNVQYT